jgi:hypothetical protein
MKPLVYPLNKSDCRERAETDGEWPDVTDVRQVFEVPRGWKDDTKPSPTDHQCIYRRIINKVDRLNAGFLFWGEKGSFNHILPIFIDII